MRNIIKCHLLCVGVWRILCVYYKSTTGLLQMLNSDWLLVLTHDNEIKESLKTMTIQNNTIFD